MKKLIALFLALMMVAGFTFPAVTALAADEGKLPVIYIVGKQNSPVYKTDENGNWLLDEGGNRIQVDDVNRPLGMTREEYILTQVEPVLKELAPALITGNYDAYVQSLINAFAPVYKEAVLDKDGVDHDGRIDWDYSVQKPSKGGGGLNYYYFKCLHIQYNSLCIIIYSSYIFFNILYSNYIR